MRVVSGTKWAAVAAMALLIGGYAILLAPNASIAAGGPDESGYMNEAKMLARGRLRMEIEPLRTLHLTREFTDAFTPLGFAPGKRGTIVPTYPPGYPVHLAIAGMIGGFTRAPFYVTPIAALVCLALMFILARELGLSQPYAIASALILACMPAFLQHSLVMMSDVPATMWVLATIVCALRARLVHKYVYMAGAAFGIAVWVRPTNALLVIPLLLALRFKNVVRVAIAALPFAIALMLFNYGVYGNPFMTGYGTPIDVMAIRSLPPCFGEQASWMWKLMTPFVMPAGLLVVLDRRVEKFDRAMLASWFVAFLLFYSIWPVCDAWWYTRFLLPATPAIIVGALLFWRDLLNALLLPRRVAPVLATLLVLWIVYVEGRTARYYDVLGIGKGQNIYPITIRMAERVMPPDALVLTGLFSGAFMNYSHRFTVRWDSLDADRFALMRAYAGSANKRWYAVLSAVEIPMDEFARKLPGKWTPIAKVRDVTVYRLDS
jgi:hypothetical protein